jgi:hypothetical protein
LLQIPLATLAAQWSDPDGDPVQFAGVNPDSANGTNNVSSDGSAIDYTNATGLADTIFYTIADVRTNPPAIYRPGDTQLTATGLIHVLPPPAIGGIAAAAGSVIFSGGGGIAGGNYYVLASTNLGLPLSNWAVMATNAFDGGGNFNFTSPAAAGAPQSFYLLKLP